MNNVVSLYPMPAAIKPNETRPKSRADLALVLIFGASALITILAGIGGVTVIQHFTN